MNPEDEITDAQLIGAYVSLYNEVILNSSLVNYQEQTTEVGIDGNSLTLEQVANSMASTDRFVQQIMGNALTIDEQVEVLLNHFELDTNSKSYDVSTQAARGTAKIFFTQQIQAGVGFGDIAIDATNFLLNNDFDNVLLQDFKTTATIFKNKINTSYVVQESNPEINDPVGYAALLDKVTGEKLWTVQEQELPTYVENFKNEEANKDKQFKLVPTIEYIIKPKPSLTEASQQTPQFADASQNSGLIEADNDIASEVVGVNTSITDDFIL